MSVGSNQKTVEGEEVCRMQEEKRWRSWKTSQSGCQLAKAGTLDRCKLRENKNMGKKREAQ